MMGVEVVSRAPINQEVDIKESVWNRWFNSVSDTLSPPNWDTATKTPEFTGLTGTFSANITFVRHGKMLFFDLLIEPTGAIISTLGTTFFLLPALKVNGGSNVAIAAQGYGTLNAFDVQTPTDLGQGYIEMYQGTINDPPINGRRAFLPTFSTDKKVNVTGWVRIQGL